VKRVDRDTKRKKRLSREKTLGRERVGTVNGCDWPLWEKHKKSSTKDLSSTLVEGEGKP